MVKRSSKQTTAPKGEGAPRAGSKKIESSSPDMLNVQHTELIDAERQAKQAATNALNKKKANQGTEPKADVQTSRGRSKSAKTGRPRTTGIPQGDDGKTISPRFSTAEYARISSLADADSVSPVEWVRDLVREELARRNTDTNPRLCAAFTDADLRLIREAARDEGIRPEDWLNLVVRRDLAARQIKPS